VLSDIGYQTGAVVPSRVHRHDMRRGVRVDGDQIGDRTELLDPLRQVGELDSDTHITHPRPTHADGSAPEDRPLRRPKPLAMASR